MAKYEEQNWYGLLVFCLTGANCVVELHRECMCTNKSWNNNKKYYYIYYYLKTTFFSKNKNFMPYTFPACQGLSIHNIYNTHTHTHTHTQTWQAIMVNCHFWLGIYKLTYYPPLFLLYTHCDMSTKFGSLNTASLLDSNELKNLYSIQNAIQNAITRVVNFFVSFCLFEAYFYYYFWIQYLIY